MFKIGDKVRAVGAPCPGWVAPPVGTVLPVLETGVGYIDGELYVKVQYLGAIDMAGKRTDFTWFKAKDVILAVVIKRNLPEWF